jgi:hypothetical protein
MTLLKQQTTSSTTYPSLGNPSVQAALPAQVDAVRDKRAVSLGAFRGRLSAVRFSTNSSNLIDERRVCRKNTYKRVGTTPTGSLAALGNQE